MRLKNSGLFVASFLALLFTDTARAGDILFYKELNLIGGYSRVIYLKDGKVVSKEESSLY